MIEDPENVYCTAITNVLSTGDRIECGQFLGYTTDPRVLFRVRSSTGEIEAKGLCPEHVRQYEEKGLLAHDR